MQDLCLIYFMEIMHKVYDKLIWQPVIHNKSKATWYQ